MAVMMPIRFFSVVMLWLSQRKIMSPSPVLKNNMDFSMSGTYMPNYPGSPSSKLILGIIWKTNWQCSSFLSQYSDFTQAVIIQSTFHINLVQTLDCDGSRPVVHNGNLNPYFRHFWTGIINTEFITRLY